MPQFSFSSTDTDLIAWLRAEAKANGRSFSDFVEHTLLATWASVTVGPRQAPTILPLRIVSVPRKGKRKVQRK